jgi:pimeloyl-ACP methyl ester carboxylesterase
VAAACTLAACGGGGHGGNNGNNRSNADSGRAAALHPRLSHPHPCPRVNDFTCATLTVPLDHASQAPGTLHLAVSYSTATTHAAHVLLFLTGGPGQPGVPFIPRVSDKLRAALAGYRLVMFDQRGTGAGALRCPALQAAAGSSDLIPVPPRPVADCGRRLGARRPYFTTPETVADIDELRRALGVQRVALDGVSYGTFAAERYALAYPTRVSRLVLDSVVPQRGVDVLSRASLQATARVLRSVCAQQGCGWDPARDLAKVVRSEGGGARILDALVADSIVAPSFPGVLEAIHQAAAARSAQLNRFVQAVDRGESAPAGLLSQGLHDATLCIDLAAPWNPGDNSAQRHATLQGLARGLDDGAFFPFDRATATSTGIATGCVAWPPTEPPGVAAGDPRRSLPKIPVLLLAGERDLSTPLAWASQEAAQAPDGTLVAIPGAGHSVQLRARDPAVQRILARFLAQRP